MGYKTIVDTQIPTTVLLPCYLMSQTNTFEWSNQIQYWGGCPT